MMIERIPMRLISIALLAVFAVGLGSGCSTNPATGKRSLTYLSWNKEIAMGLEAAPGMTAQFGGEVPDREAQMYVDEVGQRLLQGIEEGVPELPWEFTLLDSSVINAFALPGGQVYLSRGLAEKLSSEAEMAGVIGHEIGHVTARHGNQRITKQIGFNVGMGVLAIIVGASDEDSDIRKYGQIGVPALAIGGNVVLLSYGRNEELEADMLGVRYMSRAGYNPVGQRMVMEVLQAASKGGARPPEWLSTHPESGTRISRITQMLAGEYAYTQNSAEYVMNEAEYQRRMLARLNRLGPPAHGATSVGMLGSSSLWCGHCNPELAMSE
ncbi:MAG: peptidase M48 Ste24p [Phycisphaera sp.]|nr:MAG: peptidase M48 Ste24p [Phycisphaera sp.]